MQRDVPQSIVLVDEYRAALSEALAGASSAVISANEKPPVSKSKNTVVVVCISAANQECLTSFHA
jgi:hypothetical protein